MSLTIEIRDGATLIRTEVLPGSASFADYPFTLSPAEKLAITSWPPTIRVINSGSVLVQDAEVWFTYPAVGETLIEFPAGQASLTLSGLDAGVVVERVVSADSGSLALSGQAAALLVDRLLVADPGALVLSGQVATFEVGRALSADLGTLTLSGLSSELLVGHLLDASVSPLGLTVFDAGLLYSASTERSLIADPTSLTIGVQAATFPRDYAVGATPGVLTLSGQPAEGLHGYVLAAGLSSLTLTGLDVTFVLTTVGQTIPLEADPSSLRLAGLDAGVLWGRLLVADPGSLALSGQVANLLRGKTLSAGVSSVTITPASVEWFWTRVLDGAVWDLRLEGQPSTLTRTRDERGWDRSLFPPVDGGHAPLSGDLHPESRLAVLDSEPLHPPVGGANKSLSDAVHPESLKAFPIRLQRLRSFLKEKDPP